MNFRWLLFDYADPALPLSFWKRQKLIWRYVPMRKLPRSMKRGRIVYIIVVTVPLLGAALLMAYLAIPLRQMNEVRLWLFLAMPSFLVFLSWIWICIVYGLFLRSEHYYRIRLAGFDVCLGCGYWLRGLDETIKSCPECGIERQAFDEDKQTKAGSV